MPRKRTGKSDVNLPDRSVQHHSVSSLETVRSLANGQGWKGGGGAEGEVCILRSPGTQRRLLSLFCLWEKSVGGA